MRILSWNLLRDDGATPADVAGVVRDHGADIVLLQEATESVRALRGLLGGSLVLTRMPGRAHGPAAWFPGDEAPKHRVVPLDKADKEPGNRHALVLSLPGVDLACVHLSHHQALNRRQARSVASGLGPRAAVVGDFNMVGPTLLEGFADVGPRTWTHLAKGALPFRLDRCLIRGLRSGEARALPRGRSDHRPILVDLAVA